MLRTGALRYGKCAVTCFRVLRLPQIAREGIGGQAIKRVVKLSRQGKKPKGTLSFKLECEPMGDDFDIGDEPQHARNHAGPIPRLGLACFLDLEREKAIKEAERVAKAKRALEEEERARREIIDEARERELMAECDYDWEPEAKQIELQSKLDWYYNERGNRVFVVGGGGGNGNGEGEGGEETVLGDGTSYYGASTFLHDSTVVGEDMQQPMLLEGGVSSSYSYSQPPANPSHYQYQHQYESESALYYQEQQDADYNSGSYYQEEGAQAAVAQDYEDSEWETLWDDAQQAYYYVNKVTGESSWATAATTESER